MADNENISKYSPILPDQIESNPDISTQLEAGQKVMDFLSGIGIKEATFVNGTYFTQDKSKRVISSEGMMLAETKTDYIIRLPKATATKKEIVNAKEFKPTQKMTAAYIGKSQSTVSKMTKGEK